MMNKEQFTDILLTLANRDAYGPASLGYLPQMLYAKWLEDNPELADTSGFPDRSLHAVRDRLVPFNRENEREELFLGYEEEIGALQQRTIRSRFNEVLDHIEKSLQTLDLSENGIARKDLAAGFDAYLAEMLDAGNAFINPAAGVPEKIVARIVSERSGNSADADVFDPFCKTGTLLSALSLQEPAVITAESDIYPEITHIRLAFHGIMTRMAPLSAVSSPEITEDGRIRTYGWVVSDIADIAADRTTSAFQMDIHKRYQTCCPRAETLNQDTAVLTALGAMKASGHAALITTRGRAMRLPPFFAMMDAAARKAFLARDLIEAVIDVPLNIPGPELPAVSRRYGIVLNCGQSRRILIFSGAKTEERKGKILFIDGMKQKDEASCIDTACKAFRDFREIPGISAVVPVEKILMQQKPTIAPSHYTTVIEEPAVTDAAQLLRDLKRLEDRRIALAKDIATLVETLSRNP